MDGRLKRVMGDMKAVRRLIAKDARREKEHDEDRRMADLLHQCRNAPVSVAVHTVEIEIEDEEV